MSVVGGRATYALLRKSFRGGDTSARGDAGDAGRFSVAAESVEEGEGTGSTLNEAEDVDGRGCSRVERVGGCVVGGVRCRNIVIGSCLRLFLASLKRTLMG